MPKTSQQILDCERTTGYTSEAKMGADFFQWAHNTYLADLHGLLFHVPNEIPRAKGETATDHRMRIQHLIAQGLTPGIDDYIYIGEPVKNRPACAIELKLLGGTISPSQKKIHERHKRAGIPKFIVRNFAEWRYVIECVILGHTAPPAWIEPSQNAA